MGKDIVVIGASAGGVEALRDLVRQLPPSLGASLFVVLHLPPSSRSMLAEILARAGHLPARTAIDGDPIEPGRIYVAPPNYHMLLQDDVLRLTVGPRENGHRPAIDPLFRTAAAAYGNRVIGVVLSGTLDDGTEGLQVIKEHGGVAVVQDPEEALFPGMPISALEHVDVDYALPVTSIAALLTREAGKAQGRVPMEEEPQPTETDVVQLQEEGERRGPPSAFTCPECHGTLFEGRTGDLTHFTCRVGHSYTGETLAEAQEEMLEASLWSTLRALEERRDLARRLRERAEGRGYTHTAASFAAQEESALRRAEEVRQILLNSAPEN